MINYIIQLLLFQTLFLAVYDLFLQKETFFKWNRIYLLVTPMLSFIIPLLKLESFRQTVPQDYMVYLPEVVINPQVLIEKSSSLEIIFGAASIIFYVGIGLFFILFLIRLTKILKLIFSSKSIKKDNYTLIVLDEKQSAFSFFNYIFINNNLLENQDLQIIQHELIHCKHRHSLDLLYFELLKIVLWFNPMVYVYQKRITLLHEYISDAEVVKETDKIEYFSKLLAETFNVENISFINQFFKHSLIKKRIVMITKEKSQKIKQLKYLLVAPLLLSMLLLSSFESNSIENLKNIPLGNDTFFKEDTAALKTLDSIKQENVVPFALIENAPVFPDCVGDEEKLRTCLQEKIANHVSANFNPGLAKELGLKTGLKKVFVMFIIDDEGNIIDVQAKAPHKKLEEEAIRVINSLPKMTPGINKGKMVGVKYSLPIAFMVEGEKQEGIDANNESKVNPLYILDGKEISKEELNKIDAKIIKSMNVIKGEEALKKYGDKGKNGVVEIVIKQ
ncbi:M56 family metallopeptidase [Lutibacter sp.]|uniref:M56 family metallopeptidase n=1 Tax=Lutibacter sp. TaxID=1925666 RepID=UPI00356A83AE